MSTGVNDGDGADAAGPCVRLHLYALTDGRSYVVTPGGRYYVRASSSQLLDFVERCERGLARHQVLEGLPDDFVRLLEVLLSTDAVRLKEPGSTGPKWRSATRQLVVTGDPGILRILKPMLVDSPFASTRFLGELEIGELPANSLVLAAYGEGARAALNATEAVLVDQGIPWLPFYLEAGRGFLGPGIYPGRSVSWTDVVLRRRAAAIDVDLVEALAAGPCGQAGLDVRVVGLDGLAWMLATALHQLRLWADGAPGSDVAGCQLELNPQAWTVEHHFLLPLPTTKHRLTATHVLDEWRLLDERLGIVTRARLLQHNEDFPPALRTVQVDVCDMRRVADWHNDRQAAGTSWIEEAPARSAAIGEAVERYCGNWLPPDRQVLEGTYDELAGGHVELVDPESLALYSERQIALKGFPFAPFRRTTRTQWLRGKSLHDDRPVWVPASLVYVRWQEQHGTTERLNYPVLAGIAAGPCPEYAHMSALEEIIERDTTMVWWAHRRVLGSLALPPEAEVLMSRGSGRLATNVMMLPNEFGVPVAAGVVRDRETDALTIGFAARESGQAAVMKALAEAFTLQETCRTLDREGGTTALNADGIISTRNLKSWRADRGYLESCRADFHDLLDLMAQQQVFLDPAATRVVAPWTWGMPEMPWVEPPALPARRLGHYLDKLQAKGFEALAVDVTTADVALAGFAAARVLVPGLVSNYPPAFPCWGQQRIARAGVALGWTEQPLDEDELSNFPLPHA